MADVNGAEEKMTRSRTVFVGALAVLSGMFLAGLPSYPVITRAPIELIGWLWLCVILGLLVIWRRNLPHQVANSALVLGLLVFGALYTIGYRQLVHPPDLPYGDDIQVTGEIMTFPHIEGSQQDLTVEVRSGEIRPFRIRVMAGREPIFERGQKVTITGRLVAPRSERDGFDEALFLEEQRVYGVIRWPDAFEVEAESQGWIRQVNAIRTRIEGLIQTQLPEPAASLAAGLVLGIRPDRIESFYSALQRTNLTHLAAVSGQNLTLTILVCFTFLKRWWLRAAILTTGCLLIIYTILVGAEASIVRAALMCGALLASRLMGRPSHPILILVMTAALMSFLNPLSVSHDLGFQLSFTALSGILIFTPILQSRFMWLPAIPRELVATVLAASLAVIPLQLVVFRDLSLVGPLANLLVGPLIPLAMGGVLVASLIGFVQVTIGQLFLLALYPILESIVAIALALARLDGGFLEIDLPSWVDQGLLSLEWLLILTLALGQLPRQRDATA